MRILVGTDGSAFGRAAVEKACDIAAEKSNVDLVIVSAYELPGPAAAEPFVSMPVYTQEIIDGLAAAAESIANDAAKLAERKCPGVHISAKAVMGRAARVLIDEADDLKADLIVVGSHGHGFWGRALLGSVSDAVVHHASCSVVVVRRPESH